jgi:hypothetical protein
LKLKEAMVSDPYLFSENANSYRERIVRAGPSTARRHTSFQDSLQYKLV